LEDNRQIDAGSTWLWWRNVQRDRYSHLLPKIREERSISDKDALEGQGSMSLEISVIVPTYNRAELIASTLKSIIQQTYRPSEIIVVDDGSSDDTEAVVDGFGQSVKYTRIENSGECRARNIGVQISSSPWVAFCDSDDLWHPEKLMLQARIIESAPNVEYCFTNFKTVVNEKWSDETKFDTSPPGYWNVRRRNIASDMFLVDEPMFYRLLQHQPIFPTTLMMKRTFFEAVGCWNEALGRTPSVDLEFHLRCVARTPLGVVSAPVVGIRKHSSNFSGDLVRTTLGEVKVLEYVLANDPHAAQHRSAISQQIVSRSKAGAAEAFRTGRLEIARDFLKRVPWEAQPWVLRCENVVLKMPNCIGKALAGIGASSTPERAN